LDDSSIGRSGLLAKERVNLERLLVKKPEKKFIPPTHQELTDQLELVLQEKASIAYGSGTIIADLGQLSGGASRETWSFDAVLLDGQRIPLILKRDPLIFLDDGSFTTVETSMQVDRITEGSLIRLAAKAGTPAPEVPFFLEADSRTTAGFISHRLDGEALGGRILRREQYAAARPKLAFESGFAAARFHGIPVSELPELLSLDTDQELDYYRDTMHSYGHPQPGFEYGFRWLEERRELAGESMALVHGDFRNGNILVDEEGLRGVLDWEMAHVGNPLLDLGWMCVPAWRYGVHEKTVGGFGYVEQLLDGYEAGGGGRVDPQAVKFWEIFGTIRWGIICLLMGFHHINGTERSLENAAIGRRIAETEYDLLQLLGSLKN
jgi:aminoglycoside phosphotransferase (APT) family kinase protein